MSRKVGSAQIEYMNIKLQLVARKGTRDYMADIQAPGSLFLSGSATQRCGGQNVNRQESS